MIDEDILTQYMLEQFNSSSPNDPDFRYQISTTAGYASYKLGKRIEELGIIIREEFGKVMAIHNIKTKKRIARHLGKVLSYLKKSEVGNRKPKILRAIHNADVANDTRRS